MSRSSRKRRKERLKQQSDDPKWIAIRNLLVLYGLKIHRNEYMFGAADELAKQVAGYTLHRGPPGQQQYLGRIVEDASLEEWIEKCALIERKGSDLQMIYPQGYSSHQRGKSAALAAAYQRPQKWLSQAQMYGSVVQHAGRLHHGPTKAVIDEYSKAFERRYTIVGIDLAAAEERVAADVDHEIQQPAPAPRRYGPQQPHRVAKANRPPRKIR